MSGVDQLIVASDYNAIQSKIATILGSGSGSTGYGQNVASSQITGSSVKITKAQWDNLRLDIAHARQHQTGVTLGTKAPEDFGYNATTDLPVALESIQIKESWRAAYMSVATDAETWHTSRTGDTPPASLAPPSSQGTTASLVLDQVRTAAWNGRISQTVVVTWSSADEARYFFNSGGQIKITADRSGGSAGLKNTTWTTMLTNMGTIVFDYENTTCTGTGTTSTIGFYNLTTSDNLIFEKDAPAGAYAPNKFYIYGRVNSTSDRTTLYLTLYFDDASLAPPSYPDPGFGIDENVDGTLITSVKSYRATGGNVSVNNPSATTTGIA